MADSGSVTSRAIAEALLEELRVTRGVEHVGQTAGTRLEEAIEDHLRSALPERIGALAVDVSRRPPITAFSQYAHLAELKRLIDEDETQTLRASLGTDYLIKPDVTVGLNGGDDAPPLLH